MRNLPFLFVVLLASCQVFSDENRKGQQSKIMTIDTVQLEAIYQQYKEPAIYHRRFKHRDVDSILQQHRGKGVLSVEQIGSSFEGRAIYEVGYGRGEKKVMLWSQMHGDEPTATMALLDLFNFLSAQNDGFDTIRQLIFDNLELHFIPLLNPDGAEIFARRNAQQIDLNRDARVQHTTEASLLRERAEAVKPRYGFNLHDQNIYYNVPDTKNPVAISLLAPAYNEAREVNEVRRGAMQLIVGMNRLLQQYVPDAVAKYDDTHSPRGFGDNFQSWGASTVLIESGGYKGDPEKQFIRKLNFCIILQALMEIAEGSYVDYPVEEYEQIPFNAAQLHDVVLRNVQLQRDTQSYHTDIAIRRGEFTVGRDYYVRGRIEDIGDLYTNYGYDELDLTGYSFVEGKVAEQPIQDLSELNEQSVLDYLRRGIIAVRVLSIGENKEDRLHSWPIVLFSQPNFFPTKTIDLGGTANFFIADQSGQLRYAVVNGYLIDLAEERIPMVKNRIL